MTSSRHTSGGIEINVNKQQDVKKEQEIFDVVDNASMESFPASDPPGWIYREPKTVKFVG